MNGPDRYVGQTLDEKYRLERLLGRGGMGAVYLATHLGTERYVALKLIAPQLMGNDEFVERFKREARAAGRLRHPNIVDVTDFGFALAGGERIAYLVMEYLDGCTLTDVLAEEKRLPLYWVVDILEQVCNAVHEAHKQGIVHRDLKPDNIWLEPNRLGGYRAKVLDFGIAKVAESNYAPPVSPVKQSRNQTPTIRVMPPPDAVSPGVSQPAAAPPMPGPAAKNESKPAVEATIKIDWGAPLPAPDTPNLEAIQLTRAGAILGTPLFMSPEQCRGEIPGPQSDIYSLGVVAYQMLSGTLPFTGEAEFVLSAHNETEPKTLREHDRKLPDGISRVIMSALRKDPGARPQSALAFACALRANADGLGVTYRRAFALYSEYFPKIFKLSLLAHIPVIAVMFLTIGARVAEIGSGHTISIAVELVIWVLKSAASFVTGSAISGVIAIIVTQLAVTPMRVVELGTAFAVLRRRWRPFLKTGMLATLRIFLGVLLVIPGIWRYVGYSLWAPVVLMEGLEKKPALERSRALVFRSRRTIVIAMLFQFLAPILAEKLIATLTGINTAAKGSMHLKVVSELASLSSIFLLPLLAIVPALLYLKMRQLGGETLTDVMAQLEAGGARTKWEHRMRERISMTPRKHTT